MGAPTKIPVPSYQELSQALPGSYEFGLILQFNMTTDDNRKLLHPFIEDTTMEDKLRRIKTSAITDWNEFLKGCLNGERVQLDRAPANVDNFDPYQQELPPAVLVCDLHYEKSWSFRRRFVKKCSQVTVDTRPCDGTFACLCQHDDKEFYRVSKTLAVIPQNYTGLNTTL